MMSGIYVYEKIFAFSSNTSRSLWSDHLCEVHVIVGGPSRSIDAERLPLVIPEEFL